MSTTVKQVYNNEVVQADWAVTDENSAAFIKNKPVIPDTSSFLSKDGIVKTEDGFGIVASENASDAWLMLKSGTSVTPQKFIRLDSYGTYGLPTIYGSDGKIGFNSSELTQIAEPTEETSAANKKYVDDKVMDFARTMNYTKNLTTLWNGDSSPYSQNIDINGILETDNPIIDVIVGDTTYDAEETEWAKIIKAVSYDGGITFTAREKTTIPLNMQIKVVR